MDMSENEIRKQVKELLELGFIVLPIKKLVKADWNYKEEDEFLSDKLANNIKRNGQVENLIVRELPTGFYEVINGNHRLDTFKELGWTKVVCKNEGAISVAQAQRIAIETNETKFKTDPLKLAKLIKEISAEIPVDELKLSMPYSEEDLNNMGKLLNFDWGQYSNAGPTSATDKTTEATVKITCKKDDEKQLIIDLTTFLSEKYPTAKIG